MRFNTFLILIFFTINALSAGTYFKPPALIEGFTTVASAAGTTTLTRASETKLIITGATTQTVVLPDATTMSTELGRRFYIINKSSGNVTVNASGGGLLTTLSTGTQAEIHLRAAGSAAGTWDVLSSSGGGDGNLIPDGNAEFGVTNFIEGSYSAATRPAGTFTSSSGSGSFAITTSTSSPLFGATSFLLTKSSGASRQGRAIERTITIDSGYRTKMLKTRIDYTIVSGTFVAGSNGSSPTDSSLIWYVGQYNGSTWSYTEPSTFKMFSNSTTNSDWVEGEFQVKSDTTQLKLIGFISESANSAWVVKAEVGFRLSTFLAGTTITDWVAYTPTITGLGTPASQSFYARRVGDSRQVKFVLTSGTNTAASVSFTLPNNETIDSNKIGGSTVVGKYNASATTWNGAILKGASNSLVYFGADGTAYPSGYNGNNFANATTFGGYFEVPISGWSSSVQVSDGYDGRLIASRHKTASSQSISTGAVTIIDYGTEDFDKAASVTTGASWKFTAPSSGVYEISGRVQYGSASWTSNTQVRLDLYKNGSLFTYLGYFRTEAASAADLPHANGTTTIELVAGDYIDLRAFQDSGGSKSLSGDANSNWVSIKKLQAPTTMSATERVSFYAHTSANAATTSAPFLFTTITDNTHGAYSASTGKFTAPTRGFYMFRGNTYSSTVHEANCYLNNTQYSRGAAQKDSSTPANFTCSAPMNAGDTMEIRPSGSVTSSGDGTLNNFSGFLVK